MIDKNITKNCNIILINLDGLRRDKVLMCKSLHELIEKSYFFSNIDTVSPYTFASIHAIMTGTYPSKNGVNAFYNILKFKKNEITTIAEILKKQKFHTVCDINSEAVLSDKGFDEYSVYDERQIDFTKRHCDLIEKVSKKQFFLFLQNTETHNNYVRNVIDNNKSDNNEFFNSIDKNRKRYESHLPDTEKYMNGILKKLNELDIAKKTILIVFSDHGTSIGEKIGERFYGVFLYEYTMNVFTILHVPNHEGKVISKQCRTIDIFPTVLDLVNSKNQTIDKKPGKSLLPLIYQKDTESRETFAETGGLYGPWPSPEKHNVFCLKINHKKLIYNDTPETWEFYDLQNDPNEIKNVYDENSEIVIHLKSRLGYYLKDNNIKTNIS